MGDVLRLVVVGVLELNDREIARLDHGWVDWLSVRELCLGPTGVLEVEREVEVGDERLFHTVDLLNRQQLRVQEPKDWLRVVQTRQEQQETHQAEAEAKRHGSAVSETCVAYPFRGKRGKGIECFSFFDLQLFRVTTGGGGMFAKGLVSV